YLRARIAREINAQTWNQLIEQSMDTIDNYQINLPQKSQHIDVIEIQCNSPLLLNAYYTYDEYDYNIVKEGEIVVKEIPALSTVTFGVEKGTSPLFFYSISLFNPDETPDVTVKFSDGNEYSIKENSLDTGILMFIPERVRIISNTRTKTRLIFKIGYGVDSNEDWQKEEYPNIDGTLYSQGNKFVYKFPNENNEYNFTKVDLTVKSLNEDDENVKFCYSTNLGIAIDTSRENCFRTGKRIPYTLSFINPLIVGKNYKVNTDKYYISFRPFEEKDYLKITVSETKYINPNRNEEGVARQLTLIGDEAGSILSLPKEESTKVVVQINTCTKRENILEYQIFNAFTKEYYKNGKVYENDVNGVYDIIPNGYLENEIKLLGVSDTNVFIKHTGLGKNYSPTILKDFSVTFDEGTNEAIIIKPIYDEEFIFTVLVDEKNTLQKITQCDLAFKDRSKLAKYVNTFTSVSSNIITHFIDFINELKYPVGTEFDLLVYAEQTKNSKMEFLYKVISGKVGKISGVLGITEFIDNEYVTRSFRYNIASNYLYYDFTRKPLGKIASLKITTVNSKVSKVGCVFTSPTTEDDEMVRLVNKAVLEGTNACIGEMEGDSDGYDALINANYGDENNRLVIQVLYGLGEKDKKINEDEENNIINIKISGTSLGTNEGKFGTGEKNAPIPYVIDLLDIRDSNPSDYVSKVLLYSNSREMEMFYIDDNSPAPVSLFTGNIMLIYTNEELINQKYHGATTMILITDSLSSTDKPIIGEEYRFMVKYFNSAANIQYFLSSNPEGRPLNNPTTIEMTSCSQPYYYILNYNKAEEVRKLHIDKIFGEKDTIKLATALNSDTWDLLISSMDTVDEDEIVLESQLDTRNQYHFDVIEVKCKLPLLLNLFYVDPAAIKVNGLEVGDISIFSLEKGQEQILNFKTGPEGFYVYSFNVLKVNYQPNIEIVYNGGQTFQITENGVYPKYSMIQYDSILVRNKDNTGNTNTRIIFKFGSAIEYSFEGIENNIYSNQNDKNRTDNLYGYIYNHTNAKLNYTGVDFTVSTTEDNVKFCYSTNLGTYINPSLQNCYRVGKNNPYTISTLNPLVMYRDYYSDENLFYYVGFRTVELNQKITITPNPKKYDTTERNLEGAKNKVTLPFIETYSTILTPPKNNEPYIFTHIHVCTRDRALSYQFLNAYDSTNLGFNGEIQANSKFHFISVDNTKLDTELVLKGKQAVEVFVKHVGISEKYQPIVKDINISFNKETRELNWTQPIESELFEYTIYIDKITILDKLGYTLCDIAEVSKLGHYSESLTTDDANPKINVPDLGADYQNFDVMIVAEQVEKGKITILSDVYDSEGNKYKPKDGDSPSSNIGLIILIIILSVAIVAGAIIAFILYRKYKSEGEVQKKNKETSMALLNSAKKDKLIESAAQENNQIDP
ncbi:MAG: hypothetical protein IJK67_04305, partial [Bacilli bacterium]|nr:hypothetical protein [Bacilli bacterium]